MELQEALARRRMVRNYRPDPVPREVLARIVEAGLRAPSAGYAQGQSFVVVTDPRLRAAIAGLAGEEARIRAGFDPWISRAPAHVVVCTSPAAYLRRYQESDKLGPESSGPEWPVPYWWVDAGASLMAVLLAAVDEGLAAGFLGIHALPGLEGLLAIPDEVSPIGLVTLGRPAPDRASGSLRRGPRPLTEVVHWDGWGRQGPSGRDEGAGAREPGPPGL